ncbi:hypothetical protein ACROYT_G026246 [Oculina patagonica]
MFIKELDFQKRLKSGLTQQDVMVNLENFCEAIFVAIGLVVARFLLNTGRCIKAIELCKECLILLTDVKEIEEQYVKLLNAVFYKTMFDAYCLIGDYTNATKYGRELIVVFRDSGEPAKEGNFTLKLANIYKQQCKYVEAKELYERTINIMKETGERKREATAYGNLGNLFLSLGEYAKAQEYIEKALAIRMEIGDREGQASDYGNLGKCFFSG